MTVIRESLPDIGDASVKALFFLLVQNRSHMDEILRTQPQDRPLALHAIAEGNGYKLL